jgi:hypothetical protein
MVSNLGRGRYAIFSFGFLMELFERSMYLLSLGGLWEITFAIWLIIKGGQRSNEPLTDSASLLSPRRTEHPIDSDRTVMKTGIESSGELEPITLPSTLLELSGVFRE